MTTLKKLIFIGFFGLFHFLFFLFLFLFLQHKKEKTKNAIFCSKTSFLITQNFAKTLFWHTVTLFVFLKMPQNTIKLGENSKKNLDQFLTYNLDQFLTYKTTNLGPVFNSTAYIYIHISTAHIYIYIYIYRERDAVGIGSGGKHFIWKEDMSSKLQSQAFEAIESGGRRASHHLKKKGTGFYRTGVQIHLNSLF